VASISCACRGHSSRGSSSSSLVTAGTHEYDITFFLILYDPHSTTQAVISEIYGAALHTATAAFPAYVRPATQPDNAGTYAYGWLI